MMKHNAKDSTKRANVPGLDVNATTFENYVIRNVVSLSENFQDQEIVNTGRHCLEDWLEIYSHSYCGLIFQMEMMKISTEDRCVLANIIRPYNNLTLCLEDLSNGFSCYYPNPTIQELFLTIHSKFFINCTTEKIPFEDAPQGLVIALTLIPVSIIPVLVYLVVFKSKV
ncbi:receptor activity-modifying protein 3-like isoform X3 [Eleginops maclovinus]|uniref:receptor activity-modifying protein 3-like isoform X3 n=1 Tax=Eleginops maclovinus TaxID=56733 RepID=UPI003080194A